MARPKAKGRPRASKRRRTLATVPVAGPGAIKLTRAVQRLMDELTALKLEIDGGTDALRDKWLRASQLIAGIEKSTKGIVAKRQLIAQCGLGRYVANDQGLRELGMIRKFGRDTEVILDGAPPHCADPVTLTRAFNNRKETGPVGTHDSDDDLHVVDIGASPEEVVQEYGEFQLDQWIKPLIAQAETEGVTDPAEQMKVVLRILSGSRHLAASRYRQEVASRSPVLSDF